MFTVYHSNQVDVLKSLLVELIRLNPLENPFQSEQILVQSPGMSQWLKMELAKEFGVAANLDFPLPATFIWELFTKVLPDVPKRSAFNKEAMTWKLMQILPTQFDLPEFSPLKRYLDGDDDQSKRYQLSEKIADIFDGYLVYRPEWIAAWEAGQEVEELNGEHPWQPILWQALYDQTVSMGQSPYHRANLYDEFIDTLQHYVGDLAGQAQLPSRLFIFGITALPPRYMDALRALGEHIEIHLMFTNPSRYYWGDVRDRKYLAKLAAKSRRIMHTENTSEWLKGSIEQNEFTEAQILNNADLHTQYAVGNSLLASMGKLGRDNLYLLSQLEVSDIDAFADGYDDSLLHAIQQDILELREHQNDRLSVTTSSYKPVIRADDRSLQLHICHSPMREVEVLHDRLLAMFEADPELKPRDVIVMVADINAYSHAIHAVFGQTTSDQRFIPYSISDRSVDQENPILQAFMRLMALPQRRCQASELLELLEVPAVMQRFGINEKEFERAAQWVQEVGIRWGLDEQTAQQFDLPSHKQNTWLFGIERMLLGFAMPDSAGLYHHGETIIAAYDEVQGMDAELAGKLASFVRCLQRYRDRLSNAQKFATWQRYLLEMLDEFFLVELEGEAVLSTIRESVEQLSQQLLDAGFELEAEISPQVLEQYLQNHLSNARVSQRFLAGQVNFCTLMPMRSIPFKTVCLLGMNDGLYPRSVAPEGFDLINGRTRPGDRSRRDDDRYLFLEALLSAQQSLYISYVGRSIQDNSVKEPSVLVAELLEYCQQNYALEGWQDKPSDESGQALVAALSQVHPLVPFSASAFDGQNAALASYAKEWLPAAKQANQAVLESNPAEFIQPLPSYLQQLEPEAQRQYGLELSELLRFWRLPVKYFFNQRLKTYLDIHPVSLAQMDDEPFAVNNLDSYWFGENLLAQWQQSGQDSGHLSLESFEQCAQDYLQRQQAQGQLPMASFADIAAESLLASTKPMAEALLPYLSEPKADVEIDLALDIQLDGQSHTIHLVGWLGGQYQSGMVRYRSGGLHSRYLLGYWIEHLCLNASNLKVSALNENEPTINSSGITTHLFGRSKGKLEQLEFQPLSADVAKQYLQTFVQAYYQGMDSPLWFVPKTGFAAMEKGFDKPGFVPEAKWVGFAEQENKQIALLAMQKAFIGDGFYVDGEGQDVYVQRVWKQWTDELADDLLSKSEDLLKPLFDHCQDISES